MAQRNLTMHGAARPAGPLALLLALLLLAVQAATLGHQHAVSAPADDGAPSCELCTGFGAAAPAPVAGSSPALRPVAESPAGPGRLVRWSSRPSRAHGSRAPPIVRST